MKIIQLNKVKCFKIYIIILSLLLLLFIINCDGKGRMNNNINGLTETKIMEKYGKPVYSRIFVLDSNLYEYQYALLTILKDSLTKTIKIKEICYLRTNEKHIIWLIKGSQDWIIIDKLIISNNIRY